MWNFYRTRYTAGNICLVLFIAFLFTVLVAPFAMVGSAEAAQQTKGGNTITTVELSGGNYVQGGASKTIVGTTSGYELLVDLAINPLTNFETLRVDFINGNGTILSVYGNDASKVTYKAYSAVYGHVYSLAYLAPSTFYLSNNAVVYGNVYVGSTLFENIIYTLTLQPPNTVGGGSGGGGGGSTTTPPTTTTTTTTTTSTGTVTVTTTADGKSTATVAVDTSKVTEQINTNKPVVIEVPANTQAQEIKVEMAASIVTTLTEKSKELTIKTDDVQFVIPPAVLQVKELTNLIQADPNTKVALEVKEVTPASVSLADKLGVPENANLKAIGKVFNFDLTATSTTGTAKITQFNGKLKVSIPYTDSDIAGIKEDRLGAYRITTSGLVFLGGDVDKENNLVWFETNSFSAYTLMAKLAAFGDIMSHWAKNDIELLAEKGIVKGLSINKFAPDATITRAEFATVLVKALGLAEVKPAKPTFKDVQPGSWHYGAVETAAAKGLVIGYNGNFDPNGKITRQAMAVMISRALKVGGRNVVLSSAEVSSQLRKFSDKQQVGDWAHNGVATAIKEGIITGRTADTFVPKANATRAEGTVMIKKVLGSLGKL